MTDFLTKICENDDDHYLKLVYADWLEERGEADNAEAWRWIAKHKLSPYPVDAWNRQYNYLVASADLWFPGSALLKVAPPTVFEYMRENDDGISIYFLTKEDLYARLVLGYCRAKKAGAYIP